MIQDVTGISIDPVIGKRREGDPPALVASVSLAKELLGWQSSRDRRDIVSSAWDAWQLGHK
jgi:UDP-glucose 4-epimerase